MPEEPPKAICAADETAVRNQNYTLLDQLLEPRSPVSYTFISYLTVLDIIHLLAVSKALRDSLLDPDQYGYVFRNLSLNSLHSLFHRSPSNRYEYRWRQLTVSPIKGEYFQCDEYFKFLPTIEPLWDHIKYLCVDHTHIEPRVLVSFRRLTGLEELSMRHSFGDFDFKNMAEIYICRDLVNPKLKKLSFWNINYYANRIWDEKEVQNVKELEKYYETDVTLCENPTCQRNEQSFSFYGNCAGVCEKRKWQCSACGETHQNLCMGHMISRVCESCEEYYCQRCMETPERTMYAGLLISNKIRQRMLGNLASARQIGRRLTPADPQEGVFLNTDFAWIEGPNSNSLYIGSNYGTSRSRHYYHESCYLRDTLVDACAKCRLIYTEKRYPFRDDFHLLFQRDEPKPSEDKCGMLACPRRLTGEEDSDLMEKCFICHKWGCYETCLVTCGYCERLYACIDCYTADRVLLRLQEVEIEGSVYILCHSCIWSLSKGVPDWMASTLRLVGRPASQAVRLVGRGQPWVFT